MSVYYSRADALEILNGNPHDLTVDQAKALSWAAPEETAEYILKAFGEHCRLLLAVSQVTPDTVMDKAADRLAAADSTWSSTIEALGKQFDAPHTDQPETGNDQSKTSPTSAKPAATNKPVSKPAGLRVTAAIMAFFVALFLLLLPMETSRVTTCSIAGSLLDNCNLPRLEFGAFFLLGALFCIASALAVYAFTED